MDGDVVGTIPGVARAVRILTGGRWLALHVGVLALAVAMVLLGRWQLHVSESKHFSWQNFLYAVQWWSFTAFALWMWVRVMRDAVRTPPAPEPGGRVAVWTDAPPSPAPGAALMVGPHREDDAPVLYRGYVMPQSSTSPDRSGDDRMRASYNDQLWQLALADEADGHGSAATAPREGVDLRTLAAGTSDRALDPRRLGLMLPVRTEPPADDDV